MPNPNLLEDYISINESAKQLRKSVRSVYRMIERRELAVVHIGKTPMINVPASRELLTRTIKPLTKTGRLYKSISSTVLADRLAEREDRPWVEFGKQRKPITPRGIASLLEGFSIKPKEVPPTGANGYREKQFAYAFRRYLPHLSSDHRKNAESQRVAGEFIFGKAKAEPEDKKARKGLGISKKPTIRGYGTPKRRGKAHG